MAIQFGNLDRELADRQNVIKEDAARQYRGSRDTMKSITDLGNTISSEVKEYKANKRQEQKLNYDVERNKVSDGIRGEQHNVFMMKGKLDANTLMLDRSMASYEMKKWPYGKAATKKRHETEKTAWRGETELRGIDKVRAYGTLYSAEALDTIALYDKLKLKSKGEKFKSEDALLRKISLFQPVGITEWATNNKLYDPADYGDPAAEANADATRIINEHMPGMITDAHDVVKKHKDGLKYVAWSSDGATEWNPDDVSGSKGKYGFLELSKAIQEEKVPSQEAEGEGGGEDGPDGSKTGLLDIDLFGNQKILKDQGDNVKGALDLIDIEGGTLPYHGKNKGKGDGLLLESQEDMTETQKNAAAMTNLSVVEGEGTRGAAQGTMFDDNKKVILAGSVDANGLINKDSEQGDILIRVLGITDPAKIKEWEDYLMSDSVNSDYGYVKPGSGTGTRQDTRTSEQERKRSLLKLNTDQVSSLQRWAYNKSLASLTKNQPHLSDGKAYQELPYLKDILGDMGYRHGSSFMVPGDSGRYPKFGKAVKELTEADNREKKLVAWKKMNNELFNTGTYSNLQEGKGRGSPRFRFLRDRMDRLETWITKGEYVGGKTNLLNVIGDLLGNEN